MKKIFYFIVLAMLVFSAEASAQAKGKQPDFIEQAVAYMKKELKLDDFQAAAVREIMEDEKDDLMALNNDTTMKAHEKKDRGRIISDRMDEKILRLLNEEQAEKYKKLQKKNSRS